MVIVGGVLQKDELFDKLNTKRRFRVLKSYLIAIF
jgi:hypothetical protein